MNPNKALWEKGDFTKIAETMRDSGAELVAGFGIHPGMKVLDLGCGDGNTAIPEAKLGADVLGVDIASNLVNAGNARIIQEKITNCVIQEGDATNLNFIKDNSYDLVVSIFGVMFAPKPQDVANEMVRVTKPGGKIIMGNWIPGDPTLVAQVLKICSAYTPPPPEGFISPMLWGVEAQVIDRFTKAGIKPGNIVCNKENFTFSGNFSPTELLNRFRLYYGPMMNAFEAAEKNGKSQQLFEELEQLYKKENQAATAESTKITASFLKVTATKS